MILAPVSGVYNFNLFFVAEVKSGLDIRVNDEVSCRGYGDYDPDANDGYKEFFTGACAVEVELLAGDLVNVKLWDENFFAGTLVGEKYTGFSGALRSATA